jgi:hypothetical protein
MYVVYPRQVRPEVFVEQYLSRCSVGLNMDGIEKILADFTGDKHSSSADFRSWINPFLKAPIPSHATLELLGIGKLYKDWFGPEGTPTFIAYLDADQKVVGCDGYVRWIWF